MAAVWRLTLFNPDKKRRQPLYSVDSLCCMNRDPVAGTQRCQFSFSLIILYIIAAICCSILACDNP